MTSCAFPSCPRPSVARGLCAAHNRQRLRGKALTPLRKPHGQRGDTPLVMVGVRVSPGCAERVKRDVDGAREALEEWAKKGTTR